MRAIVEIEIADLEGRGMQQLVKMLTKIAATALRAGNVRPVSITDAAAGTTAELALDIDMRGTSA